jgi:hypothetical protein
MTTNDGSDYSSDYSDRGAEENDKQDESTSGRADDSSESTVSNLVEIVKELLEDDHEKGSSDERGADAEDQYTHFSGGGLGTQISPVNGSNDEADVQFTPCQGDIGSDNPYETNSMLPVDYTEVNGHAIGSDCTSDSSDTGQWQTESRDADSSSGHSDMGPVDKTQVYEDAMGSDDISDYRDAGVGANEHQQER